ncbi:MAG: hypothetical protein GEU74_12710 [Nitriliruptorales bacterium]|nr:hypothetical protein [Nitriliruptorales bacterium]
MDDEQHRHGPEGFPGHGIGGGAECTLCPVCVFLQAVSTVRPEVMQHLLSAGRELTLALTAALEVQAEAYDHASTRQRERTESAAARRRVERIPLD